MRQSAKETRQQKEQGVDWTKFEKRGLSNAGKGLYKLGRLETLYQIWKLYISGKTSLTC